MTNTSAPTQVLRRGSRGEGVVWLQQALADAGFDPGPADGIFGAGTEMAVKQFQSANGLGVDGIAGPNTYGALQSAQPTASDPTPTVPSADEPLLDETSTGETSTEERPSDISSGATPESGTSTDWTPVSGDDRIRYVMRRLVDEYGYPVNGAAGLVGNLWAESGVLPNRIEGSRPDTPMRAKDFSGATVDFTAEQIMNRVRASGQGPARPGVGLAQWTSPGRRAGLFAHTYMGVQSGANVLFDMDTQIDYLNHELQSSYSGVRAILTAAGVTVNDASDEVVYNFEIPGAVLDSGSKLPRSDSRVQEVFLRRRAYSERARQVHEGSTP
jgi:peptidoglycan hydrolase-like protein with peptidoglycan-binding domain